MEQRTDEARPERCGALIQPYVWCARTAGHDGDHSPTPDREGAS